MVRQYLATCQKELLLLWRDKINLLLLFLMPMLLVFIITLIQQNAISQNKFAIKILLINHDQNEQLAQTILNYGKQHKVLQIIQSIDGRRLTVSQATKLVAAGKYMALVQIPAGATDAIQKETKQVFVGVNQKNQPKTSITILLDPNVRPSIQTGVVTSLSLALLQIKMQAIQQVVTGALGSKIKLPISKASAITTSYATLAPQQIRPNSIQQNVPAWTVFGMFFIIVPIAGMMIKERNMGVIGRVQSAPVSAVVTLLAKVSTYTLVNLVQLVMMLLVGILILPLFGTPVLSLGAHPYLVIAAGFATSLAATSLGMLLGSVLKTFEQASIFGGVSVVIAAAVGGIMIPNYMMPESIQRIGAFSPLQWAQECFVNVFVRGADWQQILPQLGLLLGFFAVCMLMAIVLMERTRRQ